MTLGHSVNLKNSFPIISSNFLQLVLMYTWMWKKRNHFFILNATLLKVLTSILNTNVFSKNITNFTVLNFPFILPKKNFTWKEVGVGKIISRDQNMFFSLLKVVKCTGSQLNYLAWLCVIQLTLGRYIDRVQLEKPHLKKFK